VIYLMDSKVYGLDFKELSAFHLSQDQFSKRHFHQYRLENLEANLRRTATAPATRPDSACVHWLLAKIDVLFLKRASPVPLVAPDQADAEHVQVEWLMDSFSEDKD